MIDQLVSFVIRPPRAEYDPDTDLLGPSFKLKGRRYVRQDVELVNARGHTLQCSHYKPAAVPKDQLLPCVIYCHGNSGCRADANEAAVILLPANITVFALDFSGSGLSGGEYVTLGHFEKDDVATAVDHLRVEGQTQLIGLWGRSMGAVTALLYGATDPSIAGMVLDSPFSNLQTLIMELVDFYKIRLPKFGVRLAVQYMRRLIRQKAAFDIQDLDTAGVAPCTFIPAVFGHAEGDVFIRPQHSEEIFRKYAGDKNIVKFPGDHNSPRPPFFYDSISIHFHNVLNPPEILHETSSEASNWLENGSGFTKGVSRNGRRNSREAYPDWNDLRTLGIDLDDAELDQAMLFELLGLAENNKEAEKEPSLDKTAGISRSNSSLGRGRVRRKDHRSRSEEDIAKSLSEVRTHWHGMPTVVPLQGEDCEEEEVDDLARIMAEHGQSPRNLECSSSYSTLQPIVPECAHVPPIDAEEEQMLMEAIALSLQDQGTTSTTVAESLHSVQHALESSSASES